MRHSYGCYRYSVYRLIPRENARHPFLRTSPIDPRKRRQVRRSTLTGCRRLVRSPETAFWEALVGSSPTRKEGIVPVERAYTDMTVRPHEPDSANANAGIRMPPTYRFTSPSISSKLRQNPPSRSSLRAFAPSESAFSGQS